jgi:predicted DNA binding CopG/RHH family protein
MVFHIERGDLLDILEAIQKRALAEGLPYQTLISSLLHKYASGRLKEV